MPELPDLEIYRGNLLKAVGGLVVTEAEVLNPRQINAIPAQFSDAFRGARIEAIRRSGKELMFDFDNKNTLAAHLMLAGRASVQPVAALAGIKHKIASFSFEDGRSLVFSDMMSLLKLSLNPPQPKVPDALGEDFTRLFFHALARKNTRRNVKELLITQSCVRGIGNAYADEILYEAGISPLSTVGKIPPGDLDRLYDAILAVLTDAIRQIQRIAPDITEGEERSFLKVHNPNLTHTLRGEEIRVQTVVGKKTYYTPAQKFYM